MQTSDGSNSAFCVPLPVASRVRAWTATAQTAGGKIRRIVTDCDKSRRDSRLPLGYTRRMNTAFPSPKALPGYLATLLLFFCAAQARLPEMPFGFAAALYAGLVYSRMYIWLLTPMYIAGCLLADCSVGGIVYALLPPVVFTAVRLLHDAFARPLRGVAMQLYAAAVHAVVCVVYALRQPLAWVLASGIGNIVVTVLCLSACYGWLVRGIRHRLSVDESIGTVVLAGLFGWGLWSIRFGPYRPFWTIVGFGCMVLVLHLPRAGSLIGALALGLGSGLAMRDLAPVGGLVACCAVAVPFTVTPLRVRRWVVALAILLADTLIAMYFLAYGAYSWVHSVAFGAGVIVYCLLPSRVRCAIPDYRPTDGMVGARNWMTHTKKDVASRLMLVSRVFYEMADVYRSCGSSVPDPDRAVPQLAQELASRGCVACVEREHCMQALGGQTASVMEHLIDCAMRTGKATHDDLPTFLQSRCVRVPAVLAHCNALVNDYRARAQSGETLDRDRELMAMQMAGLGSVLSEFACDVESAVSTDRALSERLQEELRYQNIVCTEVTVLVKQQVQELFLVVRAEDAPKKSLVQTVSRVMGLRVVLSDTQSLSSDKVCVRFSPAPRFDLTYGSCQFTKPGSEASGDSIGVYRMRASRALVGLCDGMGSGTQAQQSARATLDMISHFYRAGLDNTKSLAWINRLLVDMGQERFSALDLCVVDLEQATADFIKLGGVSSFIRRAENVQTIESEALPIGIVEEARPRMQREMLQAGDTVVLVSDGISDALTEQGIRLIVDKIGTLNPQTLAEEVMHQAERKGLHDDASVVAFRIFPSV